MSSYESRETIPPQTLDELVGPATRHQICWYSLPKIEGLGAHAKRSATWLAIYGNDAVRGELAIVNRPQLRLVEEAS